MTNMWPFAVTPVSVHTLINTTKLIEFIQSLALWDMAVNSEVYFSNELCTKACAIAAQLFPDESHRTSLKEFNLVEVIVWCV